METTTTDPRRRLRAPALSLPSRRIPLLLTIMALLLPGATAWIQQLPVPSLSSSVSWYTAASSFEPKSRQLVAAATKSGGKEDGAAESKTPPSTRKQSYDLGLGRNNPKGQQTTTTTTSVNLAAASSEMAAQNWVVPEGVVKPPVVPEGVVKPPVVQPPQKLASSVVTMRSVNMTAAAGSSNSRTAVTRRRMVA